MNIIANCLENRPSPGILQNLTQHSNAFFNLENETKNQSIKKTPYLGYSIKDNYFLRVNGDGGPVPWNAFSEFRENLHITAGTICSIADCIIRNNFIQLGLDERYPYCSREKSSIQVCRFTGNRIFKFIEDEVLTIIILPSEAALLIGEQIFQDQNIAILNKGNQNITWSIQTSSPHNIVILFHAVRIA